MTCFSSMSREQIKLLHINYKRAVETLGVALVNEWNREAFNEQEFFNMPYLFYLCTIPVPNTCE